MKPVAVSLMLATLLAGAVSIASAKTQTPQTQGSKYFVDVDGHIAPTSGSLNATLTFSGPVQIGKVRLEAGSYLFTQISPSTFRVTSENRKKVYAVFTTVSAAGRSRDIRRAQLRFENTGAGLPPRLIAFYPDGSTDGYGIVSAKGHKTATKVAAAATNAGANTAAEAVADADSATDVVADTETEIR